MKNNSEYRMMYKRIPYSTTSIDHQNILGIIEKADNFEKEIDKKMTQFEKSGIDISTCPDYFEKMVDKYITKLLNKLEVEYANDMNRIGSLFRKRASRRVEFQEILDRLDTEIAVVENDYEKLRKIVEEMNPLKNGRLEAELNTDPKEEADEQNE